MGSLHERNRSLWVATTEPGDFAPLDGDASADVVVVGAGITGLSTARLLVEQGASPPSAGSLEVPRRRS